MRNNRQYKKPYKKTAELNSNETSKSYEYNSYSDCIFYPNWFSGMNLIEQYKPEILKDIVRDPMTHNEALRNISQMLYNTNGIYTNTVDYMTAMPTLDRVIVQHGKNKSKKARNKELMESTLRKIKDKEIVRDALFRGMVDGIAFYYFETTNRPTSNRKFMTDYDVESILEINDLGLNASIISLPTNYTKIIGIKNSSYVIAFNLDYFDIASGETTKNKLKKYPKEIREAYQNRKQQSKNDNGNWVVLDNNKTIVHKIRSKREERYGRPLVLAAINDILYGDYFTKTKRNVLDEINNRIVVQHFPEGRDKGTSALTKDQQQHQHEAVKGAVLNKNNRGGVSFFSVAAGTKIEVLKVADTDIFDSKNEANLDDKIALGMGIASSLLNGSASGSYSAQENNLELVTSQIFQWVDQITAELNKCISKNIIKDDKNIVEVKYLPITHVNKSKMVGYAKDLYLQGRGSLSFWAAACGISPEVFFALLDEELEQGYEEKYPVHATSYTLSKDDKETGRPETDNPTDKTVRTRSNGGNSNPSPTDK